LTPTAGWFQTATNFVYGALDSLTMGVLSTAVNALGLDSAWLDSCSTAFTVGSYVEMGVEVLASVVFTGGTTTPAVLGKQFAKSGVKATVRTVTRQAGRQAAELGTRMFKTARAGIANMGAKTRQLATRMEKNLADETGSFTPGAFVPHRKSAAGRSGADTGADFVADSKGTVIPTSQARLEGPYGQAGLPSKPTRTGGGTMWTMPDKSTARVMPPDGKEVRRVIFSRNGPNNPVGPFTGKAPQPPRPVPPGWTQTARDLTHFPLAE
jgi:hypothetical protein